jgi:hypothetical protein
VAVVILAEVAEDVFVSHAVSPLAVEYGESKKRQELAFRKV